MSKIQSFTHHFHSIILKMKNHIFFSSFFPFLPFFVHSFFQSLSFMGGMWMGKKSLHVFMGYF